MCQEYEHCHTNTSIKFSNPPSNSDPIVYWCHENAVARIESRQANVRINWFKKQAEICGDRCSPKNREILYMSTKLDNGAKKTSKKVSTNCPALPCVALPNLTQPEPIPNSFLGQGDPSTTLILGCGVTLNSSHEPISGNPGFPRNPSPTTDFS